MDCLLSTFINLLPHKDIILLLIVAHITIVLSEMDLRLILIITFTSAAFIAINAERNLHTEMIDVNGERLPETFEKRTILIDDLKSNLFSPALIKMISQRARKLKNNYQSMGKLMSNKRQILRLEMPNKVVREIRFKDTNAKHSMVQFKGYTTVPQKEKVIRRRHACHGHSIKRPYRAENVRELSHKSFKSNDYNEDEIINTEIPFVTLSPLDYLGKILTKSQEATKESDVQNTDNRLSADVRKYESGESEDQREYIFVNVPQIAFEYVDNRNRGKKRHAFKHKGLLKRSVIEEENHATTASNYKTPSAETGLITNFIFKNINV